MAGRTSPEAHSRLLTCMSPHMALQKPWSAEGLAAKFAFAEKRKMTFAYQKRYRDCVLTTEAYESECASSKP